MSDQQLAGFGHISDNSEDLKGKGKARGVFGLNHGFITHLSFNPLSGKDKSAGEGLDVTVKVKDAELNEKAESFRKENSTWMRLLSLLLISVNACSLPIAVSAVASTGMTSAIIDQELEGKQFTAAYPRNREFA